MNCIESVDPGKKPGRPVALHLHPNFDILSEMKVLHIRFLDDQGKFFCVVIIITVAAETVLMNGPVDRQEFCQLLSERPR